MKLTEESARLAKQLPPVQNTSTGNLHATLRVSGGQFARDLQFVSGSTAVMNLAELGEKVDEVLRAQTDAAVAALLGVQMQVEEALTIRDHTGTVSDIAWSKVQAAPQAITTAQAFALLRLQAIYDDIDKKAKIGALAKPPPELAR